MNADVVTTPGEKGVAHRGLITMTVILASIMQALDNTIANIALPDIQGSLSATQDQMSWVLTSYITAAAIMTPLSGWLAGQYGRKRVFMYSIVGFTVASALCGLAQSLPEIVFARLAQGVCGAALIPMSQAVLLDINPPSRHARAMTLWIMAITLAPVMGPALGGWLTQHYNWRWVFYINLPFGVLALLCMLTYMPEFPRQRSRFDFFGFAALSSAIGAMQLLLDRGQLLDWFNSNEIRIEAIIMAVGLYLFTVHLLTATKRPFISPSLFKDRNFVTGSLFIFIVGAVMFASLALMPPLMQDLFHYPILFTGVITAPRGIGVLLAMFAFNSVMKRVDIRLTIAIGFGLTAVSLWQMAHFSLQMDYVPFLWATLLQGFGTGLVYVPLTTVTFATLAATLRNEGTAMFSLLRNAGSSVGISAVTTLLVRNTQIMHSQLAERITPYSDIMHTTPANTLASPAGLTRLNGLVTEQAAMIAYNNNFKLMMLVTITAMPLVFMMRSAPKRAGSETVVVE